MNTELMEALTILEKEKNISRDTMMDAIENSLISACKNHFGTSDNIKVIMNRETCDYAVYAEKEVEKVLGSDLLLVQTPIWAMSTPWQYTKWQDIVLTDPRVCGTDGRTRKDPNKLYGTGGFLTKKRYWISTTWNAPEDAVCEPGQFFDARGLEGVLMPLHKQFQYMGIKPLAPSFAIFDVYKNPTVESDLLRWKSTLEVVTGKLLIGQTQ